MDHFPFIWKVAARMTLFPVSILASSSSFQREMEMACLLCTLNQIWRFATDLPIQICLLSTQRPVGLHQIVKKYTHNIVIHTKKHAGLLPTFYDDSMIIYFFAWKVKFENTLGKLPSFIIIKSDVKPIFAHMASPSTFQVLV